MKRILSSILVFTVFTVSAACGGDSEPASSEGTQRPGQPASSDPPAGQDNPELAKAKEQLAPYLELPSDVGISEPLSSRPDGKTVNYIECAVENCTIIGKAMDEAAEELGVNLVHVNAGATPEEFSNAFDQTVQDRPDGVIVAAIPKETFANQLAVLEEQNIPVVVFGVAYGEGDGISKSLHSGDVYENEGRVKANWVAVDSNQKAKILYVKSPTFDFANPLQDGFVDQLGQVCPECEMETIDVQPNEIGATVPGKVVSYLQSNPDTTYVVAAFGALHIGVPAALQESGISNVKLVSQGGVAVNDEYIKADQQAMDLKVSLELVGWASMDSMARLLVGDDVSKVVDTDINWNSIVTQKDVTWNLKEPWPFIPNWRDQLRSLWDVSN